MELSIPKQIKQGSLEDNAQYSAEKLESFMRIAFICALAFNIILSVSEGAMFYMFVLIRNLQLILNLPIYSVVLPANVMMVLSIIYPIVLFDILENDYDINASLIIPFDLEKREELAESI